MLNININGVLKRYFKLFFSEKNFDTKTMLIKSSMYYWNINFRIKQIIMKSSLLDRFNSTKEGKQTNTFLFQFSNFVRRIIQLCVTTIAPRESSVDFKRATFFIALFQLFLMSSSEVEEVKLNNNSHVYQVWSMLV